MRAHLQTRRRGEAGQSMVEMAMILPFVVMLVLGVIETSYALMDHHTVTRLSREGANLISRDATLDDAYNAMRSMSTLPVDFTSRSKIIFTAVKRVSTTGVANSGKNIAYQWHTFGASVSGASALTFSASPSAFGSGPDYTAKNSDTDGTLVITSLPANFQPLGSTTYVAEIYSTHLLITPFDRFGINIPTSLYSIAYF